MAYNPFSVKGWQPVIRKQPDGVSDVALTFDDGPSPDTTPALLDQLRQACAKATFFLSGVRVAEHPELVGDIVAHGHAVYAHGWEHVHHEPQRAGEAVDAMARTEALLAKFRPTPRTYLVRLPYNAGFRTAAMHEAMRRFHADPQFAWWSHSTVDYAIASHHSNPAEIDIVCARVAEALEADQELPGAIILLHEAPFDTPASNAALVTCTLVTAILGVLERRGLRAGLLHTVPQLSWRSRHFLPPARPLELWQP